MLDHDFFLKYSLNTGCLRKVASLFKGPVEGTKGDMKSLFPQFQTPVRGVFMSRRPAVTGRHDVPWTGDDSSVELITRRCVWN